MFLNHISIASLLRFVVFVCFSLKERSAQPTISLLQADYQTAGLRQTLNSSGGHSECSPDPVQHMANQVVKGKDLAMFVCCTRFESERSSCSSAHRPNDLAVLVCCTRFESERS